MVSIVGVHRFFGLIDIREYPFADCRFFSLPQKFRSARRQDNRARSRLGFGFADIQSAAFPFSNRAPHFQLSVFRIEVLPLQSADFTPPQSCGQLGVEEIVPPLILSDALHESLKLFVIEYLLRRIIVFGNRCADRWIFNNQP